MADSQIKSLNGTVLYKFTGTEIKEPNGTILYRFAGRVTVPALFAVGLI